MKLCPYCGAENQDVYRFCINCHNELPQLLGQQPTPQPQYPPSPPPSPFIQPPSPQQFPMPPIRRLSGSQIVSISLIIVGLILIITGIFFIPLLIFGSIMVFVGAIYYIDAIREIRCRTQPEYALALAGWFLIASFILGLICGILFLTFWVAFGIFAIISSIFALLGGIFALQKKNFEIALIGGIFGCLSIGLIFGLFVSVYAITLIVMYRGQFKKRYYGAVPTMAPGPEIYPQQMPLQPPASATTEPAPLAMPQPPMPRKCPICGSLVDEDADFCPNCGTKVR